MHFVLVSLVCIASQAGAGDWVSLFDGRTLDGWRGDPTIWSVENGEIVGRTTPGNARTTYLHRDGVFDDFELEFEIKLEGEGANSGMQYRSTPRGPDVGDGFDLTGYQAGYYGYLWSLVYAEDMFQRFQELGMLSPKAGREYRKTILARGGTVDEMQMVREFLGREPRMEPFLKKLGLEVE
jgi:hypothetical protein